jgi:SAM-dependent methyltransferase
MQKRHLDKRQYFEEQVITTRDYVIPFIESVMKLGEHTRVLEVGCGEGGNLVPFLEKGCRAVGVDLSVSKIADAHHFLNDHPGHDRLTLIRKDIYDAAKELAGGFDLIMMRDVIEHIHDQNRFMGFIRQFLRPGGLFFLAFPPWYNPFGGHQQICRNRFLSKLPYFHLLPERIYRSILKTGGETGDRINDLLEIKETGISIERFQRILASKRYAIVKKEFYFINPNYQVKFNLKPRKQSRLVSNLYFLRNYLTTSCYYLVRDKKATG